jgi:hypothetical protein
MDPADLPAATKALFIGSALNFVWRSPAALLSKPERFQEVRADAALRMKIVQ